MAIWKEIFVGCWSENAVNDYFSGLDKSYYIEGMKGLEKRWTKCIKLKGDYVEK
jgi:hypothetical protein